MTVRVRFLLLASYAVVTFLSFPHPVAGGVLDLGWGIAWLGPALLVMGLQGLAPRRATGIGFLAGLAAHSAILHWIYIVTVDYGHAPVIVGLLAPVLLASYLAIFPALFGLGWALLARASLASPLAIALLWTADDHLRSILFTGFPWATIGYAQHENSALMALTAYTGVYGMCFATALGGAAIARAVSDWRTHGRPGGAVWCSLGALVAAHVLGFWLQSAPTVELETIRVGVLQGNVDQDEKWSPDRARSILAGYEELTLQAAAAGAEVILWPETSVPGSLEVDVGLRDRLARLSRDTGATLVLGAVGIVPGTGPEDPRRFYDSAYLVDPLEGFTDRYDKSHLVPYGEYVPLRGLLGMFVRAVASGMTSSDVSAGTGPRSVDVKLIRRASTLPAGVVICYELLFPDLVRRFVRDGAQVLFAITNDAWYGRTGAPYQFLAITAVRSAETRVWTARAANTGVSAFIDSRGRVRAQTAIFERAFLVQDVPLHPAPIGGSFYTRHGDVFVAACWAGLIAYALVGCVRRRTNATG